MCRKLHQFSRSIVSNLPVVTDFLGYSLNLACAHLCFPTACRVWQAGATDRVWSTWMPQWQGCACAQGAWHLGWAPALQSRCVEEHIMYESLLSAPKIYWRNYQYLASDQSLPWGLLQSVLSLAHSLLHKLAREWHPEPRGAASALAFAGIAARIKDPLRAAKHGLNPLGGVLSCKSPQGGRAQKKTIQVLSWGKHISGRDQQWGDTFRGAAPGFQAGVGLCVVGVCMWDLARQVPLQDLALASGQQRGFLSVEVGCAFWDTKPAVFKDHNQCLKFQGTGVRFYLEIMW